MPKAEPNLSQRMTTPWLAFGLAVGGGALLGREIEPVFRMCGLLAALGGGAMLATSAWRNRRSMAEVLAAIPLADKTEGLLRKLPKAWAALEQDNLSLRAQAEAEQRLRQQLLNQLRTGVVLLDRDHRIQRFNQAAQTVLGHSSKLGEGELLAAAFREPESLLRLEAAYRGKATEWTLLRNGRTLHLRALPFADPAGPEPLQDWVLVTLEDATRQEALETTRQKFISNASHELRTPVTSIRLAVENLQEGALVQAEGDASLRTILRSVERMTLLLEDISELSRIETGALQLAPAPLRLDDFCSDLLDDLRGQSQAAGVRIRSSIPEELESLTFQADPLRLGQLLGNLLGNAIKFSPRASEVRFTLAQEGPWLVWTVADQGPGLSGADAKRVFERFYRAPATRGVPGTGLGLAIAKHLALLMAGELELESELGAGATFIFKLPLGNMQP